MKASGAGGGIIDILEVVQSDMSAELAKEVTQENKVTTALKQQDVKYKTAESKSLDKLISELTSDRETTETELAAVLEYFAKLKDRCIAKAETYEQRKARREAEIAGLKEALAILSGEAFMQKESLSLRRL